MLPGQFLNGGLMNGPWENWIPGVLNKNQMLQLCDVGFIIRQGSHLPEGNVGKSSLDLTLSNVMYEMPRGSVKPSGSTQSYGFFIEHENLGAKQPDPADGVFTLEKRHTYVFKLSESLNPGMANVGIFGQATAKSSVGRVDVLARLIVSGMDTYEGFNPSGLAKSTGDMYLEVTPITFRVKVKVGTSLSQLRLFYGDPRNAEVSGDELFKTVFKGIAKSDGSLSVDLDNEMISGVPAAAFCHDSSEKSNEPIPLWDDNPEKPEPWKFWKLKKADSQKRLTIQSENFYILRSREEISVPPGIAIYCRANDETIGEMRIHYAGFVHPLFGWQRKDGRPGTPLIFEVRGHQVEVTLANDEKMANLTFYRMSQDCGEAAKGKYEVQTLKLSDFFGKWPDKLRTGSEDGTVEPEQ